MRFKFVSIETNHVKKLKKISYNLKDHTEETVYGMLLDLVKRKVEERISKSIFHKTASTMNLTRYSILNLINAMLHNLL